MTEVETAAIAKDAASLVEDRAPVPEFGGVARRPRSEPEPLPMLAPDCDVTLPNASIGDDRERACGAEKRVGPLLRRVFGGKGTRVFTGLVEAVGRIESRVPAGVGARLHISTSLGPLVLGESIAVMGVCLTVDAIVAGGFEADASAETLAKTTLGRLGPGHHVHLERAMQLGGRLGGHIVSGHVDGVARLIERRPLGEAMALTFGLEPSLAAFVAKKGSIAIDGVSLTVNEVERDRFHVVIVPHTQQATSLSNLQAGTSCNIEVDVLARYVARWLQAGGAGAGGTGSTDDSTMLAKLAASGYL